MKYQKCMGIAALMSMLLVSTAAQAQTTRPIDDLFSTGVDDASAPIALGVTDAHWEVQEAALGWVQALYEKTNYCGSCGGIWVDHPQGDNTISRPLAHPNQLQSSPTNRTFSWRTTFTLPADALLNTATITYRVGYDDYSRNATDSGNLSGCAHVVWLNGTAYPMTASPGGNNLQTTCEATIPAGSAFVAGANTLEFRIGNGPTYYGFRFQKISATYEVQPCGNGSVDAGEACDDGNDADGDGCSSSCQVEAGYSCEPSNLVVNGDFEQGDVGFMSVLPADTNPISASPLCGNAPSTIGSPHDLYRTVTDLPYASCGCDGGAGLCLAINGGGGAVWSQQVTGLQPNTQYTISLKHALKVESQASLSPKLELKVDGVSLASATASDPHPAPLKTMTGTFTTGPGQTSALVELINPNSAVNGNDMMVDSITIPGPTVCETLCGNGVIDAGEVCDDGNTADGDGCSAACAVEDGWSCTTNTCAPGAEEPIADLFSTGVDDAEAPLALGVTDTHWDVQESALGWLDALYEKTNYCGSCGGIWVDHPQGDNARSRPLAHPNQLQTSPTNRTFSWRTTFTLPAHADPATATISYRVGYDDYSRNRDDSGNLSGCEHVVWLNGTPYEMAASTGGNNLQTTCQATIPAGSAFVNGTNTLEFRIGNGPTYYGFRFEKLKAAYLCGAGTGAASACTPDMTVSCGDGVISEGESCDDGNMASGDGCAADCTVEDGYMCAGEPSTCTQTATAKCGDGVIQTGETCDDANVVAGDGCSDTCQIEDGWICQGEPSSCDLDPSGGAKCGDGVIQTGEGCDDANVVAGDGCSDTCQIEDGFMCVGEPSSCDLIPGGDACGDGTIGAGEGCDDGNTADGDGCSASCAIESGWICKGEPSSCDLDPNAGEAKCGDGVIQAGEGCDDANVSAGDGCSATCQVEAGFMCTGEPSACDKITNGNGNNPTTNTEESCASTAPTTPAPVGAGLLGLLGLALVVRRRRG